MILNRGGGDGAADELSRYASPPYLVQNMLYPRRDC